jgi:tetratricopeptide (TPR) repeat protein
LEFWIQMKTKECPFRYCVFALLLALPIALVASGCNSEASKAQHVSRGETYLKAKQFQEASLEFRSALQIDDRMPAAHWGLARAYEGLERISDALDELKRAVDLDPNNLEARVKLGNYYLASNTSPAEAIAEAERLAKEILQKDPNYIEGHILLASVLFRQDQTHPEKALAELNRAIEIDPKRVESYLSLARFYISLKDEDKAEETYRRAILINDGSALAHKEHGKFLVQVNRRAEAERELKRAVEVEPADRDSRFVLASFYLVNNQIDKAEESFKALAEMDKDKLDSGAVLADFYSSIGRYDEAVRIYQDIISKLPDYVQGRYRLGEILLMRGDTSGASEQVTEVLKKNDRDMQALLLRSRIRMLTGEPKAAIEDLKEVLKQQPNDRAGLYFMAEANLSLGLVEQARVFAGDLDRYWPDYLPGKLIQGQISLAAGDPKNALRLADELMSRLAKATPDRGTTQQLLTELRGKAFTARASAEIQLGDIKAARADFHAARDAAPNDPASYVNLAAVALKENKIDEAIGQYEKALAIDSANFNALNGLVNIYSGQKRFEQAHARLERVLSVQPNNASLHYLQAQVYGVERNAQGAENELRRALEIDPKYLAAYSSLAALYINQHQEDRAIAEYQKIVERKPDDAATYTLIGMLEDGRKNHTAAVQSYRRALEIDQNGIIAANNLAWSYAVYGTGNLDEAVRLAQGVVQRNPDVPGYVDTLGWVYYKKGLNDAAAEQLRKAVAGDEANARKNNLSPSATYHFHLGMALAGRGDKEGARNELQTALRLGGQTQNFPDADDARKALTTL